MTVSVPLQTETASTESRPLFLIFLVTTPGCATLNVPLFLCYYSRLATWQRGLYIHT
ncbi:hypothetical protein BDV28DRAFT_143947 [Aspergillus coremiiformis]|uniref:Uncharacterized protein n=1 Tax=Aspergillus coremiiformis TaxID=138285 RepID=A0A5N6YRW8_9EURO|nr:hypothetical protein BDV28DRAFT_143947 [Aspergillus coremiiformis]